MNGICIRVCIVAVVWHRVRFDVNGRVLGIVVALNVKESLPHTRAPLNTVRTYARRIALNQLIVLVIASDFIRKLKLI